VGRARAQRTEADRAALEQRVRSARQQYQAATAADADLKLKLQAASVGIAVAGDVAVRATLAASPVGGLGATSTYGACGTGDAWAGYDDGAWCSWYWNCYYPSWCNWWWGSCGWGWSSGWGFGWSSSCWSWNTCAMPSWYWPCYWPSYSYAYCWPSYAWWSPAVIYEVVERPVVVEAPVAAAPAAPAPRAAAPDFGQRAATEYMALGDRAFTEGRYGDAVHYYARAVEFAPEDGVLQLVLSDALFATGDYHYAAFALRRALELNPELASLGLDKRTFYGVPGDFDRQLAVLERFVADHPIDEDARLVLAANHLFALQLERALAVLDEPYSEALRRSEEGKLLQAAAAGLLARRTP
jgi:Flp pilus assembly protein TadD